MQRLEGVLGDRLVDLVASAKREVLLVAPYVKASVIAKLLASAPTDVPGKLVTRWRPEEVAAGVSDLEVLDEIAKVSTWELHLCHELHAKYFRIDDVTVVGSANLTNAALSWRHPSNIELLVEATGCLDRLLAFENEVLSASVRATPAVQLAVREAAALFPRQPISTALSGAPVAAQAPQAPPPRFSDWFPSARNPADIAYSVQHGVAQLSTAAAQHVCLDLAALDLPLGATRDVSETLIRSRLSQHPLVARISEFCREPRRFGAVRDLVAKWLTSHSIARDPDEAWQTLMRWLLFFFPTKYRVTRPHVSELFCAIS